MSGIKNPDQDKGALLESERRLARAQAIAHIGDWEWELATNAVYWSDELYRIYGFEPQEIAPDYGLVLQQMHPDSKEEFLHAIDAALKGEKSFEMDYIFFRKDGGEAILHTIGQVFRDESGAPVRMAGVVQDITERKRDEMLLRVSEDKFRTIFDNANDGILIADAEKKTFLEANRSMCAMLGYSRDELLKMGVADIHPEEEFPAIQNTFERQLRREIGVAENLLVKRKDGALVYVDISSTPINMEGKPCMMGIFRDVTDRHQAEEKLQQSELFIRSILDSVDEGFIVVDRDYLIITANRAYCEQVGLPINQVLGKSCFEVSHKLSRPCHEEGEECSVNRVFTSGLPQTACHHHEAPDGEKIYVETKAFPLRDASGNVTRVIETVSDITEKRLLEEERLKVQKLEAIGTLAGGIAHDFNNLLQSVFGYLSLAKLASANNDESTAALGEAEKALNLSVKLTKQLLTFSKGGKPHKRSINLGVVIDNAVRFSLSGSHNDWHIANAENLWPVEADEGQITQVIQNIILNASQAMPKSGKVDITTRNIQSVDQNLPEGLEKRDYVEVSIRDEGSGINEKDIARIFDPYFTTKEKGSGLGLATSYSIIKNHGGMIRVLSSPGKGTTFFVYLPATKTLNGQKQTTHLPNKPTRLKKILVMDDDPMICDVAGAMLKAIGHEVESAANGEEAIALYQAALDQGSPFNAAILDLTIRGGLGGVETLRKLVGIDPDVKAIVSSGYADNDVVASYRNHGFVAFLNKPYNMDGLRNVLHEILNNDS